MSRYLLGLFYQYIDVFINKLRIEEEIHDESISDTIITKIVQTVIINYY